MTGSVNKDQITYGDRVRVYSNVLGQAVVSDLLDYAARREAEFAPAGVYQRATGKTLMDPESRDCMRLQDLGPFREPFAEAVNQRALPSAQAFGLTETVMDPVEFEVCAYGHGGRFGKHVDVVPPPARVRILTCVYYFSARPRRFSGGQLRVFPWPNAGSQNIVDIEPECDSLVVFPSFLRHEVLSVALDSPAWTDRRFSLTCWLCRPKDPKITP